LADAHRFDLAAMSDALITSSKEFSFVQAVVWAERRAGKSGIIGRLGPVADEPLRFRSQLGLGFPGSDLGAARLRGGGTPEDGQFIELVVNFFGLYGSSSPLPGDLTENLILSDDTGTARDFLDIFNHRLVSLLYRIWRKYRFELERTAGLDDIFSTAIKSLAGLADDQVVDSVDKGALLGVVENLILWCRSARNVAAVLRSYFPDAEWELEEFQLRQFTIDEGSRWRLGRGELGEDIVLGDRMNDVGGRIGLWCQAKNWEVYGRLLPSGDLFTALTQVVRRLLRDPLEVAVVPWLAPSDCRATTLGSGTFQLGFNSWMGTPALSPRSWPHFMLPEV
jgi:type VI secretion system protein ImpH